MHVKQVLCLLKTLLPHLSFNLLHQHQSTALSNSYRYHEPTMAEPPAKRHKATANGDTADSDTAKEASQTSPCSPGSDASSETPSLCPISTKYNVSDLVTLVVGPEKAKLIVHDHWLIKSSEFFRAALKKEWREGQTRIIKLEEEHVQEVAQYLDYLYEGELPTQKTVLIEQIAAEDWDEYNVLCNLYTLGERLVDIPMRNAIIRETVRLMSLADDDNGHSWFPSWTTAAWLYENTTEGSPMRRLLVDMFVVSGLPEWLDNEEDGILNGSSELLIDVVKEFSRRAKEKQDPKDYRDVDLTAEDYLL